MGSEAQTDRSTQLLLVEDSSIDARIVAEHLRSEAARPYVLVHVDRLLAAQEHLEREVTDCVLLDLSLPDASRMEALRVLTTHYPDIPVVVLSGHHESLLGPAAVYHGAQDYLPKDDTDGQRLWRAIQYAVERKRSEIALRHRALHCDLTGLPNRVLFLDRLEVALGRLSRSGREGGTVAVLFLDLDGFKAINDRLGHDEGDKVLVEVGRRLESTLRAHDTAARHGGDEFLLLTECPADAALTRVLSLVDRLHEAIGRPIDLGVEEVTVRASIGVALAERADVTPQTLLRDADAAMYHAKRTGARVSFFDDSMREEVTRRLDLISALHRAIEDKEYALAYAPIQDLGSGQIAGWEAQRRWSTPLAEAHSPAALEALLDEHGLLDGMTGETVAGAGAWLQGKARGTAVTVNLNIAQLSRPGLTERVHEALIACGVEPGRVWLEISEGPELAHERVQEQLRKLETLGVRLVLDGYGSGFTTLLQLEGLPFAAIKLDRSLIAGLERSPTDREIVHAIVTVARTLDLKVAAEGVDRQSQLDLLGGLGCHFAQGPAVGFPE